MVDGPSGRELVFFDYLEAYEGGPRRPYLWLELTGPNGEGTPVFGLLDTGADVTVLPMDYAFLLGYGDRDLEESLIAGVGGQQAAFRALVPCRAVVEGLEDIEVQLWPEFMTGQHVLWGRADFMTHFGVLVDESSQLAGLLLPLAS